MKTKVAGCRVMLGLTQEGLSKVFDVSVQSIKNKENGITTYSDDEKLIFRNMIRDKISPSITIDEIFLIKKFLKVSLNNF